MLVSFDVKESCFEFNKEKNCEEKATFVRRTYKLPP